MPDPRETESPELTIVVTLYNEEASLAELHRRTVATLDELGRPFELIYVDDGSTDGTFAMLESLHDHDGRVRVVRFKRNFGQSTTHSGAQARPSTWPLS